MLTGDSNGQHILVGRSAPTWRYISSVTNTVILFPFQGHFRLLRKHND